MLKIPVTWMVLLPGTGREPRHCTRGPGLVATYLGSRPADPFQTSTNTTSGFNTHSPSIIAAGTTLHDNMKCMWLIAALSLFQLGSAVDQKKSAIIWFDSPATPASFIDQVKDSILKAGGKITHTYTIIKYVFLFRGSRICC